MLYKWYSDIVNVFTMWLHDAIWHLRTAWYQAISLQWRHNGQFGISNHRPSDCLLNCLFKPRSKKTSKLGVTDHCEGNSWGIDRRPVNFPHKGPVTWLVFPFDDVIMFWISTNYHQLTIRIQLQWNFCQGTIFIIRECLVCKSYVFMKDSSCH